jgi:hypothetical protein
MTMRIMPASSPLSSNPPRPNLAVIGTRMTTNAAVGPETLKREPPLSEMTMPATMAV